MPEKSRNEIISEKLIRAFVQFKRLRMDGDDMKFDQDQLHQGLKHSEIMLMFGLKEAENGHPDGISVSDLSSLLRVKPPSITPIIGSLEQRNMLERSMDANDRRIIRVRLKEEGNRLIEENKRHMVLRIKSLVEYLGEEKSTVLADLINEVFSFISTQSQHKKQL
jgi:DNA-binding MarR family transcriptional regulator